jgi:hypothetical protein
LIFTFSQCCTVSNHRIPLLPALIRIAQNLGCVAEIVSGPRGQELGIVVLERPQNFGPRVEDLDGFVGVGLVILDCQRTELRGLQKPPRRYKRFSPTIRITCAIAGAQRRKGAW